jgi:hypothetical protein
MQHKNKGFLCFKNAVDRKEHGFRSAASSCRMTLGSMSAKRGAVLTGTMPPPPALMGLANAS